MSAFRQAQGPWISEENKVPEPVEGPTKTINTHEKAALYSTSAGRHRLR
jgi:hypothetical protein